MKKSWFETEGPIELTEEEAIAFYEAIERAEKRGPIPRSKPFYKELEGEELRRMVEKWMKATEKEK